MTKGKAPATIENITINEAAERLRYTPRTLVKYLADVPLIDPVALEAWLKTRENRPEGTGT